MTWNKKLILLFLSILVSSTVLLAQKESPPGGGVPKDFVLPVKEVFELDNGMDVTLVPFGSLPKVLVRVVLRVGNLNDPPDGVWLADLTAQMLKEGTTGRNAEAIAGEAASMGGSVEVSIENDQSWIGGDVLSEFGPDMVELLADLVLHPGFPENEFQRLKKDMIRDLSIARTRSRNLANEKFRAVLFGDHPYGRVYPTEEMLENYTIEDVRNFYLSNFGAARASIYVVGRFDAPAVKRAIRETWNSWESGPDPLINIPGSGSERKVYLVDRPGSSQSTIYVGLPVIDPSSDLYIPLEVTNTILGGYFSSRITTNIREDKGYTYSPLSSVSTRYRDAYWVQVADVGTEVTGAALKEIFYEIDRLQSEPPPPDEFQGVQNYMAGRFLLQNSSRSGIVGQLVFMDLHGLPDKYLGSYVKNVYAVTPQDVQRLASDLLRDGEMIIVVVGDIESVRSQVEIFGPIVM